MCRYNCIRVGFTRYPRVLVVEALPTMIRILLVDDQASARTGLRLRLGLEPDLMVVGEAASGEGALELAPEAAPDVIVMDVSMPGMGGIAATARLRRLLPSTAVVVLSLHDDPATRADALTAGAVALVAKQHSEEFLTDAIRSAHDGRRPCGCSA